MEKTTCYLTILDYLKLEKHIDEKGNLCYIKTARLKLIVLNDGGDTWQNEYQE